MPCVYVAARINDAGRLLAHLKGWNMTAIAAKEKPMHSAGGIDPQRGNALAFRLPLLGLVKKSIEFLLC